MPKKGVEEVVGITPISNTLVPKNKYFSENPNPMENLPEKKQSPTNTLF